MMTEMLSVRIAHLLFPVAASCYDGQDECLYRGSADHASPDSLQWFHTELRYDVWIEAVRPAIAIYGWSCRHGIHQGFFFPAASTTSSLHT
jgi:hypothetical protein